MYHKVGHPVASRGDCFLNVSGEDFLRQMRIMARLGYQARPFAEIAEAVSARKSLPRRVFAVTFDDGYDCIGKVAAPILRSLGFPGTVFVVPEGVGRSNAWDSVNDRPLLPLMNWEKLDCLAEAGWEIGGHTRTHPHLDALTDACALADIVEGKEATEARLGRPLLTFCYPYGHYNAQTPELVRAAGFIGACTTRTGLITPTTHPMLIPRIKVAYRDGVFGMLYRMLVRPGLPDMRTRRRDHAVGVRF